MSAPLPDRLCFVHLSKTGGKTMYRLLERAYGDRARYVPIRGGAGVRKVLEEGGHACVYGAFPYRYVPGWTFATLIREPVARVCSYYRWLKGKDPAQHPGADLARGSLERFVDSRWPRLENAQAAQLAGYGIDPPTGVAFLNEALDALVEIDHVGVTERYRDFVAGLGLPTDNIPRENATIHPDEPYPDRVLSKIRRRNAEDVALHNAAFALVAA